MHLDCHQVQGHLLVEYGVWMLVSFIEQRGREVEEVKKKAYYLANLS